MWRMHRTKFIRAGKLGMNLSLRSYHRFLVLIWLYASYEEWVALRKGLHQGLKRLLELRGQCWCSLAGL